MVAAVVVVFVWVDASEMILLLFLLLLNKKETAEGFEITLWEDASELVLFDVVAQ